MVTFKCIVCGELKPHTFDYFDRDKRANGGYRLRPTCKICRQAHRLRLNREKGISPAKKPDDLGGGIRRCNSCKKEKPCNLDNFGPHHRGTNLKGRCLQCDRKYHSNRLKEVRHRTVQLLSGYRRHDGRKGLLCDLSLESLLAIVSRPCVYCGTQKQIGADRIDNSQGHTSDNVVPCCYLCNSTRSNRFSHEEMRVLGEAISRINASRKEEEANEKGDYQ